MTPDLEIAPGMPVKFPQPKLAGLTWERDSVHMPAALSPLAGDYALVLGNSLNEQYPLRTGGFPQLWYAAVWHGYVYYAFERNATDEEWVSIQARIDRLTWERASVTESLWRDEVLPELRAIYARIDAIDAEHLPGAALADAWDSAWRDAERAWQLHMDVTPGIYRARAELTALYAAAVPGASRAEANRLLLGLETDLAEMDRATEALARLASATPAVREALRSGTRSLEALATLDGGPTFVAAVSETLALHGHLGQLADDLQMPSFGEQPELYVAEIAKRLDGASGAEARRLRLRDEADGLVEGARSALSANPDALARFAEALGIARRIGPLSEGHNYWIDRAALAHLRRLALRVGARLVRDRVLIEPADVFYLRRAEVGELLRAPRAQQALVGRRRAEHEADRRITPAPRIGSADDAASGDRPHFTGTDRSLGDDGLRGTGASAGIARGRARIVLDMDGFARVGRGDIVVCYASNPSFVPLLSIAAGLIATVGGILSHGAVVAREFGVPAVVGVREATTRIADGQELEIDGTTGAIRLL